MEPIKLTETQSKILIALGKYKFLNAFQMSRIVGCIPNSVNRAISRLPEKLVAYQDFSGSVRRGMLPRLYYLTKGGAEILELMGEEAIRFPSSKIVLTPESNAHRTGLVDIQIAVDRFLESKEMALNFFEVDFDVVGRNRGAGMNRTNLTKIFINEEEEDFIIPDVVFSYYSENGKTPFFLGELHRGKDTGRFIAQLWQHKRAIMEGSPTDKYKDRVGHVNPRILCVFEEEGTRNAVARRVLSEARFQDMHPFLLFATIEDVREDFENAFKTLSNERFQF